MPPTKLVAMRASAAALAAAAAARAVASIAGSPSLAVVMLARDEALLLRRHLPEWQPLAEYFVIGLDDRSFDLNEAERLAAELLAPKPVETYSFSFEGFGSAKSLLLRQAHARFPTADYLLLAEPDMLPVASSFDRSALDTQELVYAIRRAGKASRGWRLADSVFRNDGHWKFEFRIHETPVYSKKAGGPGIPETVKDSGWMLMEVEGESARDSQARAMRLREELRLIELDLAELPGHPRLVYYAGALRYELASELLNGAGPGGGGGDPEEIERLAKQAAKLLSRRARDPSTKGRTGSPSEEHAQQQAAAGYYCGRTHLDLLGDPTKAEKWYRQTMKLEADFLYAHVALIHLLFKQVRYKEALGVALAAEEAAAAGPGGRPRRRLFMDCEPLQVCDIPLLLSKSLYYVYSAPELKSEMLGIGAAAPGDPKQGKLVVKARKAWSRRGALMEQCLKECPAAAASTADKKLSDVRSLQKFWKGQGLA